MKTLLLTAIALLVFGIGSLHARKICSKQSGSFTASSTWKGGRTPSNGDTVTIDTGHTVFIKSKLSYSGYLMRIVIYGVLDFSDIDSRLKMPYGSSVNVMSGGKLMASGAKGICTRTIEDGSFTFWQGCEGSIAGPEKIE